MKAELPGPVAGAPVRQVGGQRRPAVPGTWGVTAAPRCPWDVGG